QIYRTIDFIFGNAAVVLQICNIYTCRPPNKTNTLTAQGRTDPNQNNEFFIHNCRVTPSSDLKPVHSSVKTYFGRPWQKYSSTTFMKTYLDNLIDPAGKMPWSGNFALNTLYYREYMSTGPCSFTTNRVNWKGHHRSNDRPLDFFDLELLPWLKKNLATRTSSDSQPPWSVTFAVA
ncbi:hypothetical protein Tsubulata_025460, partial [Turnera subulata]